MFIVTQVLFWGTLVVVGSLAALLLWSDGQDRERAIRAAHDRKWGCACGCTGLVGYHSHLRCEFEELV